MLSERGRPPAWTGEQAERVLELAAEGVSQRRIALAVFGNPRYRGRVERILGGRGRGDVGVPIDLQALIPAETQAPELRALFSFYQRLLERTGTEPSLADIERLLRIHQRLTGLAQLEQLTALTRDPRSD